jgi:hypothetical protein
LKKQKHVKQKKKKYKTKQNEQTGKKKKNSITFPTPFRLLEY